jgi:nicotinamide mononucleotide (NMN) deamidase PncC
VVLSLPTPAPVRAEGARRVLGSDIGVGITGVAGPDEQEGIAPGTVFVGLSLPGDRAVTRELHLPGDRQRVRQFSAISALDLLRRTLLEAAPARFAIG